MPWLSTGSPGRVLSIAFKRIEIYGRTAGGIKTSRETALVRAAQYENIIARRANDGTVLSFGYAALRQYDGFLGTRFR